MKAKKETTMHRAIMRNGSPDTRCGRGFLHRTRVEKKVTCGRCKLLDKFDRARYGVKRGKKGAK